MYAPPGNVKRQKTLAREPVKTETSSEAFPGIGRVEYKPETPPYTEDLLYYRYYNASERIHGRTMEDWLRPSVFIGSGFTPYPGSMQRPWCEDIKNIDNYKKSMRAVFELCIKLGVKYWSGYDRDLAPDGDTLEETQTNFDTIVELVNEYQLKTGIKPLWIGVDFKYQNRYKNGAATNPDANVVTYAGYQTKRTLDIAQKLNSECFLYSGEQEGFEDVLGSDLHKDCKHYARFLKMIVEQKDRIGYRGQLLMQTFYKNSQQNRYTHNLHSTLAFLKHYNYDRYFKGNVTCGNDFHLANIYSFVGSVDVRKESLINTAQSVLLLKSIIENGGIAPGGLTFYLPSHNSAFEPKDFIESYVVAIDSYAKALRLAVKLVNDAQINKSLQMRYMSFSSGWGAKLSGSEASFEECEEQVKKLQENNVNPQNISRFDHWSSVLHRYVDAQPK